VLSEPILTDWHTVADVRAALHAGHLTGGSWVELSLDHPELRESAAVKRFIDYLNAYGVRVQRSRTLAPTAVYVRRPTRPAPQ
jgi:hypothetical protein